MANRPKRPADFAQRANLITDIATGQAPPDPPMAPESARAKVRRKGGLKGEKVRGAVGLSVKNASWLRARARGK